MSNYPLSYKLSWPFRFAVPSLGTGETGFAPASGQFMAQPSRSVRLAFVGDISGVANRRAPLCDDALRHLLGTADLVVGNCESPVVERPNAPLATLLGTHHAMTRRFLAEALDAVGLRADRLVLSVANNHVLDQGVDGYEATLAALDELGIRTIGASTSLTTVAAGPLAVGLLAFTQWRNAAAAAFAGRVAMTEDVFASEHLVSAEGADLICAVPHWDWEFRHFPQAETRRWASRLAGMGVGLVAGHHAHVVQPVERIGDTLVAYGLGDFLGTAFARQPWPGRIGSILLVEVSADVATRGRIASYRMVPVARQRDGDRERLMLLEAVDGALGSKMRKRWNAVFAPA